MFYGIRRFIFSQTEPNRTEPMEFSKILNRTDPITGTSTKFFFIDTNSQRTSMTSALLITKTLKAPILMLLEHW